MVELLEFWDVCQGEMHSGCGTSPREKHVAVSKDGREEPPSPLSSGIELQGLELAALGVDLVLVRYFLNIPPFFSFGMVMYILCHCTLKICTFLFFLVLQITIKR